MKIRIILQSRLNSQRLPAKALLPIAGIPAILLCAARAANQGREVLVATTDADTEEPLVRQLQKNHIPFIRGASEDVLSRFEVATADLDDNDIAIRLTADNLFPDGHFIDQVLNFFLNHDFDFVTSTFPGATLPYGLSVEIFRVKLLRHPTSSFSEHEKEHVTPWVTKFAKNIGYFTYPTEKNLHHLRCTLDTFDDYLTLEKVFSHCSHPIQAPWHELVDLLKQFSQPFVNGFPTKIIRGKRESEFTLGTAQMGFPYGRTNTTGMPKREESIQIIEQSLKYGISTLDTARAYGIAEKRIGEALKGGKFSQVKVVTKCDPFDWFDEKTSKKTIVTAVEASILGSCHALGCEMLSTVLLHRWQHFTFCEGAIWKRLLAFQQAGMIENLGVSLYSPQDAIAALQNTEIKHLQIPFNILDSRWLEPDIQQAIAQRPDVVIHARSPLLQGILASEREFWPTIPGVNVPQYIETLDHLTKELGLLNRAQLCYTYVRSFPWVNSVVVGVETLQQLQENVNLFQASYLDQTQKDDIHRSLAKAPERLLNPSQW